MGKYSKSYFENPYLEEGSDQTKYSAEIIMDEARQKWRVGSWRARSEAFELDRSQLTGDAGQPDSSEQSGEGEKAPASERPTAARFRLDIDRDLTGDRISRRRLQELNYSPSYRPQGEIEERIAGPRGTLQRYDVLAGELEAPPEDLSFVTDADARREREAEKGESHSGALRRDTRRLETSVDERRSELIKMLPDHEEGLAAEIVREASHRRRREDAEIGRVKKKKAKRRYTPVNEPAPPPPTQEELIDQIPPESFAGSRLERLPQQSGMDETSIELPEFSTEARYWSQITGDNPTWSEVAAHSVHTIPVDEDSPEFDGRYIRPDEDSGSEYAITPTRARVRSTEAGEFKNEYIREANIDPERIKQIMEHHYRGRWIPPEFFADDALVEDYFHALSSGQTGGEDFITWAYRRKQAEHYQQQAAEQARRQYARAVQSTSRRRRPAPAHAAAPSEREDMMSQYEQARQMGYEQGAALSRKNSAASTPYAGYPGFMPPYGGQPYAMPPYGMPPYVMPPYGMVPPPAQNIPNGAQQYQGMYPELFEGTESRPEVYYQQQYRQMYQQMPPAAQSAPAPGQPPVNAVQREPQPAVRPAAPSQGAPRRGRAPQPRGTGRPHNQQAARRPRTPGQPGTRRPPQGRP